MSHYFKNDEKLLHDIKKIDVQIFGTSFSFFTDSGVFSKSGLDYGTQFLLEQIGHIDQFDSVIDMGCGYGPIGIFLAKKNPTATIYMYDVNERAVDLAKRNAHLNQVSNVVIEESFLFDQVKRKTDVIVSNPPIRAGKQTVFSLYEQAFKHLNDKGTLFIVIQKKQGAPSSFDKLSSMFTHTEIMSKSKGYWVIKATK